MKRLLSGAGVFVLAALLLGCSKSSSHSTYGYVEGNLTYVASPVSGRLERVECRKGDTVKRGQLLFQLEKSPQLEQLAQAKAKVKQAQAQLRDLLTGKRAPVLRQIQSDMAQAQAQLNYTAKQLKRNQVLVSQGAVQQEAYDKSLEQGRSAEAALQKAQAQLVNAKLPARPEQIKAAQFALQAAEASMAQMQWQLQQKTVNAPVSGFVFDQYYWKGEQVPMSQPVLSILNPKNIKVVFFVPEKALSRIKMKQTVEVKADGQKEWTQAHVMYIAPKAEFTPPVIYSRQSRNKLVYRIEARFPPEIARAFHPGQPVDVRYEQ